MWYMLLSSTAYANSCPCQWRPCKPDTVSFTFLADDWEHVTPHSPGYRVDDTPFALQTAQTSSAPRGPSERS
jgi:hypothetical protein